MSDNEYEYLTEYNTDELIEALNFCGCDSYYSEYRDEIIAEIKKRLNNRNPAPKLLTQEQLEKMDTGTVVWFEQKDDVRYYITPMIKYNDGLFKSPHLDVSPEAAQLKNTRFWSERPTDEQRKAVKWDG